MAEEIPVMEDTEPGMRHTLSSEEVRDLAWSVLGLGLAFTIFFFVSAEDPSAFLLSPEIVPAFVAMAALVAVSYIPHEMAHRVTARSMDAYAEYRMWRPGVLLAVLTAFLPAIFAASGGTRMYTRSGERYGLSVPALNIKMIGYISIVGPLINVSLAVLFSFIAVSVTGFELYGVPLLETGARINTYLALAHLVPLYPLDGYKVLRWSSWMWFLTVSLAGLTFLLV